jgi:hypothetical protein
MFDICGQYLRPGRVFLISFIYPLYSGGAISAYQIIGYHPEYFKKYLSWPEKISMMKNMDFMTRLRFLRARIHPKQPSSKGYQAQTQNEYGDETYNAQSNRSEVAVKMASFGKPQIFNPHSTKVWEKIESFTIAARSKGADVLFAYPNIFEGALDLRANQSFFNELNDRAKALNLTIVGKPETYQFGKEFIFDSIWHQTMSGQEVATDRLVTDLNEAKIIQILKFRKDIVDKTAGLIR